MVAIFFVLFFILHLNFVFFFNDTATTEIYTLSDTFPYTTLFRSVLPFAETLLVRSSRDTLASVTGVRSEEHTSELQSPLNISYAVFCLKKKRLTDFVDFYEEDRKLPYPRVVDDRAPHRSETAALDHVHPVSGFAFFFFLIDTATTEIYTLSDTLSLHDALPISDARHRGLCAAVHHPHFFDRRHP